jgi:ribosomal protein S12 methylthiotransferase accessory factor
MMQIEVGFPGGARVDASFNGFVVRTDQPAPFGEGTAPSPFEHFLASLATCAGIYVLSFCQQREIPVDGLKLVQKVDRDEQTGMLSHVAMEIMLPAGFPEKYRNAVVRAAEQCAVKKYMENPPRFTVVAVGSSSRVCAGTPGVV